MYILFNDDMDGRYLNIFPCKIYFTFWLILVIGNKWKRRFREDWFFTQAKGIIIEWACYSLLYKSTVCLLGKADISHHKSSKFEIAFPAIYTVSNSIKFKGTFEPSLRLSIRIVMRIRIIMRYLQGVRKWLLLIYLWM